MSENNSVYTHYSETRDGRNVRIRRVMIDEEKGMVYNNINGHETYKELTPEEVNRYLDERLDLDGYHYVRRQMNLLTRRMRGLQRHIIRQLDHRQIPEDESENEDVYQRRAGLSERFQRPVLPPTRLPTRRESRVTRI